MVGDRRTLKLQEAEAAEVRWCYVSEGWNEIMADRIRFCVPTGGLNVLREYLKKG